MLKVLFVSQKVRAMQIIFVVSLHLGIFLHSVASQHISVIIVLLKQPKKFPIHITVLFVSISSHSLILTKT